MSTARAKQLPIATTAILIVLLALALAAPALASNAVPVKEIETSHFGWEVDKTTKGKVCTVESHDECQPGTPSAEPGAFEYPGSVAGAGAGSDDIYVLDRGNHRVQELGPDGTFVLMFGAKVNKKGGDLCTAAEEKECQAGTQGSAPGQFTEAPQSIAVDSKSGDVYVAEFPHSAERVQEFTPNGEFVLEIGHEVNETKDEESGATNIERNLCTAEEVKDLGVKCTAPTPASSPEPGAFTFASSSNMLAVGGPEDLLYVGEEHGVQVFDSKAGPDDGHYEKELSLSTALGVAVTSIAVDRATGDLYTVYTGIAYEHPDTIVELDPSGAQINTFTTGAVRVLALAVNSEGLLAASESAAGSLRGSLYEVGSSLHLISHFASHGSSSIAFNEAENLYAAFGGEAGFDPAKQEVIAYRPVSIGALFADGVRDCESLGTAGGEADVSFGCTLEGEVDPWGVSETSVWFQWGVSAGALSERTEPAIPVASSKSEGEEETPVKVSAHLSGLLPNQAVYGEVAGEDRNVRAPESITSAVLSSATPSVPPRVLGEPVSGSASPTSIVLFAGINPENTLTYYKFEYAPLAECPSLANGPCTGRLNTSTLASPVYGRVPVAQEVTNLQPATAYRYRLVGENETAGEEHQAAIAENGAPTLPEGTFQTAPAPAVSAQTGAVSLVTSTSALVSGAVDPDGEASTYAFELGVYEGAGTRYGIVQRAPLEAASEALPETVELSGLQPGTTYAYRISIRFGDGSTPGSSATGEPRTFTTLGLPAVLVSPGQPAMLSVPGVAFPSAVVVQPTVRALTDAQKLAKALAACGGKPAKRRAACRKRARKQYAKAQAGHKNDRRGR